MENHKGPTATTQSKSINGEYKHHRKYPTLPNGYDWETQKSRYYPPKVHGKPPPYRHRLDDPYGKVYCHRGLYQRSTGVTENSQSAIENGLREGLFLHEIDAFALNGLGESIVAHDQDARGVTEMEKLWKDGTFAEILRTPLVGRGANTEGHTQGSFLKKGDYVLGLIDILWGELNRPTGRTLQIDLRGEDLAGAISFYLSHTGKQTTQYWPTRDHHRTLVYRLFEGTILKGYNHSFKSFDDLKKAIEKNLDAYETRGWRSQRNPAPPAKFSLEDLHGLPPLIMVFSHGPLRSLAEETEPKDKGSRTRYEHFHSVVEKQIASFVAINTGKRQYSFILDGLGLGYNRVTRKATNPLNGEPIIDSDVITESCLDRAMIDVSLELREKHPTLLFASCTRLPDVITPEGKKFKADYKTSGFEPWPDKDKEIPFKLKAIHGGLYPRSHIVIADDPLAEIVARTWIDEELGLDRSKLLHCSYETWLELAEKKAEGATNAIKQLNSDFLPNMVDPPEEHTMIFSETYGNDLSSPPPSPQYTDDLDQRYVQGGAVPTTSGYIPDELRVLRHSRIKLQVSGEKKETSIPANAVYAVTTLAAYRAALVGDMNAIRDIFSKDATYQRGNETIVNIPIGIYGTVLGAACVRGDETNVQLLLDAGADIHGKAEIYEAVAKAQGYPSYLKTPLEIASGAGRTAVVKTLLRLWGPNTKLSGILRERYHSAFFDACEGGHTEIVKLFLEGQVDVNFVGYQGNTALGAACKRGNLGVAKQLLEEGANFTQPYSRAFLDPRIIQLLESYGSVIPVEVDKKESTKPEKLFMVGRKNKTPPIAMPERNFEPIEIIGPTENGPYIRILGCKCLVCFLDKALYATILKTGDPNGTSSGILWRLNPHPYHSHDFELSGIIMHSIFRRIQKQRLVGEGSDA